MSGARSRALGQLAAGRSTEEVLADYPYLERPDILAALEFAATRCRSTSCRSPGRHSRCGRSSMPTSGPGLQPGSATTGTMPFMVPP
jgi:hypothetical protein